MQGYLDKFIHQLSRFTWLQTGTAIILILMLRHWLSAWSSLPLAAIFITTVLLAKYVGEWSQTWKNFQAIRYQGGGRFAYFVVFLPALIPAAIKFERTMWSAFFHWLFRRRPANRELTPMPGLPLYYRNGNYGLVLIFALLACATDIPVSAWLAGLLQPDPAKRTLIHIIVLAVSCFSMIWVIADRYLVSASCHTLTEDHLHLRIGSRFLADIPNACILHAEKIDVPQRVWCLRNRRSSADIMTATPIDAANLVLMLDTENMPDMEYFKLRCKPTPYLMLYVDEPDILVRKFDSQSRP